MGTPLIDVAPDSADLLDVVQRFCEKEVGPAARRIDESAQFFPDLLTTAAGIGLQSLIFDENGEIDPTGFEPAHEVNEMLASYSGAFALAVSIARLHGYMLARYARPHIRHRWLPGLRAGTTFGSFMISEPHAGTDVRAMRTVARRDGDAWVINGEKAWITQSPAAHFGVVLTKLESDDRDAATAAFVVDYATPGLSVGRDEPMSGFRGMPMASVAFSDVRVPDAARLLVDGFNGMLEGVNLARLDAASYGLGFMRGCLRECVSYTSSREAFGSPLAQLQLVQASMGQMLADYLSSRAVVLAAVRGFTHGGGGDNTLVSAAKLVATEAAMRVATTAAQLLGGAGVHLDYTAQRFMRDAKVLAIIDGTSQIHQLMLGRAAVRTDWAAPIPTRR